MKSQTILAGLPVLSLLFTGCLVTNEEDNSSFHIDSNTPNVVIVTWHDTGRWFGCYGNENVHTPAIDSLALRGVMFTNYWSTFSVCSPSRASMLTGRYPASNGVKGLAHPPQNYALHADELHLSELLRDAVYGTFIDIHRCVRTEKFKLIWNFEPAARYTELPVDLKHPARAEIWPFQSEDWPYAELYDLEKDPDEFHNLAFDPPYQNVLSELSTKLEEWMRMTGDILNQSPAPCLPGTAGHFRNLIKNVRRGQIKKLNHSYGT